MSVGGIDSCAGGAPTSAAELSPDQAMANAQMGMLADALDMAQQLNAMMLRALEAGGPAGVGTQLDTYA
ncbi:MAG: hypothetical protein KDC46_15415 [Thermoleophilia bacterium]|nr:hypothetical protein [Thermoleophilia bacterium]